MPVLAHGAANRAELARRLRWQLGGQRARYEPHGVGLWALPGELGLILAALTTVLIGNPASRASVRLPSCCPNRPAPSDRSCRRAGGNLLRSTGFFDGIAVGGHAAVFVAWTLAGLVVLLAAGAGHRHLATERAPIRAG
jgi:hypothetical protein